MIIIHRDPIVMRRLINQHNIECLVEGKLSEYCCHRVTYCSDIKPFGSRIYSCNRCAQRNDMEEHPERAFIEFTSQSIPRREFA